MVNLMKKIILDTSLLIEVGIKQALLNQLDSTVIKQLISYTMDNFKAPTLLQNLSDLISLELKGKKGAVYLALLHLASLRQLKSLTASEILEIIDDYKSHKDSQATSKNIKSILVSHQQNKLYDKTEGVKGEYYL